MPSPTYEPCTKATPTSGTASGPLPHETVTYKSDAHPRLRIASGFLIDATRQVTIEVLHYGGGGHGEFPPVCHHATTNDGGSPHPTNGSTNCVQSWCARKARRRT